MSNLLIGFEKEIETGLFPSVNARQGPLWKDGRNVVFEDGQVKAALGQYVLFNSTATEPITGIKSTRQTQTDVVYYGTPTKLFRWEESTGAVNISKGGGYTGTDFDLWSFARWGEWMVASNGVDPIQVDKRDGLGFRNLTGPSFTWAKVIFATDTHLIAMNTSESETDINWTDLDDIENWTAASTNEAGSLPQRNLNSGIIGAFPLGQALAVYTNDQLLTMNFIGTPFIFGVQKQLDRIGIVSKFGVATRGNIHYGFGPRGIWISDGSSVNRIDPPAVHQFVFGNSATRYDKDNIVKSLAYHDILQTSMVFSYPTTGSLINDISVAFNYVNNTWTVYNYGRTVVDDSGLLTFVLAGDAQGNVYQQSVQGTPPQSGVQGILDVTNIAATISELGYGETGYGELGYGFGGQDVTG